MNGIGTTTGGDGPLVVGVGGTGRADSTTDWALSLALRGAEESGARTVKFDGAFLGTLPLFLPHHRERGPAVRHMLTLLARADGVVLATPSYHGGVAALLKNALDFLEDLRDDHRPYLHGRAVGCVVSCDGSQSGGTTMAALRSIVHALRAWPVPLGVALTAENGRGARAREQLSTVGRMTTEFAHAFGAHHGAAAQGVR
ncbi:NAD(P)H-dependent oxidoreductase [Streptomyces actinomycinicus]|uniref:NAD(P)H-dependent oxidoreductase n=1 Tax=Streptomyces actinomycinicus TaxID=1695166 RepID=A0A937EIE6_9ACTN|nr:NADPH-dependent FMN reductase [Streptomyces actinomycinicus]MBL1082684.1 NAD(P)H-dependent oxidoreductase [Streptomyces actinomycinicus]